MRRGRNRFAGLLALLSAACALPPVPASPADGAAAPPSTGGASVLPSADVEEGPLPASGLGETPPPPLLERGLDALGLPPSKAALVARGWAQLGTHGNLGGADRDDFRGVDDDPGEVELRQAALVLERVHPGSGGLDLGGRLKGFFGTDAVGTRALGMDVGGSGPEERFDILEAVASVDGGSGFPARLEGGKFLSPHGYESAEAPANDFPSRGLLFTYATPTTHTGARLTARAEGGATAWYAAVRGWDNGEDPNGRLTHMVGGSIPASGASPGWALNASTGPEDPEGHHRRTLVDGTATWKPGGGETALVLDVLRGSEEEAALDGHGARWTGAGAYVARTFSPTVSAALRIEVLTDDGGSRTGYDGTLGGISAALTVRPIPGLEALRVRLEARHDRAWSGTPFDGGGDGDQSTVALDAILEF